MEIASNILVDFSPFSLPLALIATCLCCLCALFAYHFPSARKSKSLESGSPRNSWSKTCNCACSCRASPGISDSTTAEPNGGASTGAIGGTGMVETAPHLVSPERQTGASMMEQLVPEITTHALSYLDYPSLCRLSMTNSLMRKAANDDNAWKALYHKDFTLEQDCVTPVNGWKAYYAATRAIVNINSEFFSIIKERSLQAMGCLWLNADYVKCIHTSGEMFTCYNEIMESWRLAFNWEQGVEFQVRDVRTRVMTDVAWVTMKAYVNMETGPFNVTNVFEFHKGRWYMVHHHSSLMLIHGGAAQVIVQG